VATSAANRARAVLIIKRPRFSPGKSTTAAINNTKAIAMALRLTERTNTAPITNVKAANLAGFSKYADPLGIVGAFSLRANRKTRAIGRLALWIGLCPVLAVLFLLAEPRVWESIPLVRSTDITRVWWFSNVFLALGVARFVSRIIDGSLSRPEALGSLALSLIALGGVFVFGPFDHISFIIFCSMVLFAVLMAVLGFFPSWLRPGKRSGAVAVAACVCFFLCVYSFPNYLYRLRLDMPDSCYGNFAPGSLAAFQPPQFLSLMEPFHRMAAEKSSLHGLDATALYGGVLGSGGRSVVAHREFRKYLDEKDLVHHDESLSGYHFRSPWRPELLRRLGIRYVISNWAPELDLYNWAIACNAKGENALCLYEDPLKPTPFYLLGKNTETIRFLRDYSFIGNSAFVHLPENAQGELVATFTDRPGFQASIDGETRQHRHDRDWMIRLKIKPGDRLLRLSFSPFTWSMAAICFLAGLLIAIVAVMLAGGFHIDKMRSYKYLPNLSKWISKNEKG